MPLFQRDPMSDTGIAHSPNILPRRGAQAAPPKPQLAPAGAPPAPATEQGVAQAAMNAGQQAPQPSIPRKMPQPGVQGVGATGGVYMQGEGPVTGQVPERSPVMPSVVTPQPEQVEQRGQLLPMTPGMQVVASARSARAADKLTRLFVRGVKAAGCTEDRRSSEAAKGPQERGKVLTYGPQRTLSSVKKGSGTPIRVNPPIQPVRLSGGRESRSGNPTPAKSASTGATGPTGVGKIFAGRSQRKLSSVFSGSPATMEDFVKNAQNPNKNPIGSFFERLIGPGGMLGPKRPPPQPKFFATPVGVGGQQPPPFLFTARPGSGPTASGAIAGVHYGRPAGSGQPAPQSVPAYGVTSPTGAVTFLRNPDYNAEFVRELDDSAKGPLGPASPRISIDPRDYANAAAYSGVDIDERWSEPMQRLRRIADIAASESALGTPAANRFAESLLPDVMALGNYEGRHRPAHRVPYKINQRLYGPMVKQQSLEELVKDAKKRYKRAPQDKNGDVDLSDVSRAKGVDSEIPPGGSSEHFFGKESLDSSYDAAHAAECCPHCGARLERGDDGCCNRCGKDWPAAREKESADYAERLKRLVKRRDFALMGKKADPNAWLNEALGMYDPRTGQQVFPPFGVQQQQQQPQPRRGGPNIFAELFGNRLMSNLGLEQAISPEAFAQAQQGAYANNRAGDPQARIVSQPQYAAGAAGVTPAARQSTAPGASSLSRGPVAGNTWGIADSIADAAGIPRDAMRQRMNSMSPGNVIDANSLTQDLNPPPSQRAVPTEPTSVSVRDLKTPTGPIPQRDKPIPPLPPDPEPLPAAPRTQAESDRMIADIMARHNARGPDPSEGIVIPGQERPGEAAGGPVLGGRMSAVPREAAGGYPLPPGSTAPVSRYAHLIDKARRAGNMREVSRLQAMEMDPVGYAQTRGFSRADAQRGVQQNMLPSTGPAGRVSGGTAGTYDRYQAAANQWAASQPAGANIPRAPASPISGPGSISAGGGGAGGGPSPGVPGTTKLSFCEGFCKRACELGMDEKDTVKLATIVTDRMPWLEGELNEDLVKAAFGAAIGNAIRGLGSAAMKYLPRFGGRAAGQAARQSAGRVAGGAVRSAPTGIPLPGGASAAGNYQVGQSARQLAGSGLSRPPVLPTGGPATAAHPGGFRGLMSNSGGRYGMLGGVAQSGGGALGGWATGQGAEEIMRMTGMNPEDIPDLSTYGMVLGGLGRVPGVNRQLARIPGSTAVGNTGRFLSRPLQTMGAVGMLNSTAADAVGRHIAQPWAENFADEAEQQILNRAAQYGISREGLQGLGGMASTVGGIYQQYKPQIDRVVQAYQQGGPMAAVQAGWNELPTAAKWAVGLGAGGLALGGGLALAGKPGWGALAGLGGAGLMGYGLLGQPGSAEGQLRGYLNSLDPSQVDAAQDHLFNQLQDTNFGVHTPGAENATIMHELLQQLRADEDELLRARG